LFIVIIKNFEIRYLQFKKLFYGGFISECRIVILVGKHNPCYPENCGEDLHEMSMSKRFVFVSCKKEIERWTCFLVSGVFQNKLGNSVLRKPSTLSR